MATATVHRYVVRELLSWRSFPFAVVDSPDGGRGPIVDLFRTRTSAQHHADALNYDRAHVEPHRSLGVRIVPNSSREETSR